MSTYVQQVFRFGNDDGSESAATFYAAQNTNINPTISSNTNLTLRIAVANTAGGVISTRSWQLQYSYNGGTYTDITTSSSKVKAFDSSNLTDESSTTNRTTGASGTFVAGLISETGICDGGGTGFGLSRNLYTEFLYTLTLINADLSNGDTLDFQISLLNTYTVTPRITVTSGPPAYTVTPVGSLLIGGTATTPTLYGASGKLLANGIATQRTTGTYNPLGSLLSKGLATPRTTGLFVPTGQLLANGIALQRTGGTFLPSGSLSANGLSDTSSTGGSSSYTYSPSGGVGSVTAPHGGSPYVTGTVVNTGGGKKSTSPANSNHVRVGGTFNSVGGGVGAVQSPDGGHPVGGVAFAGSGRLGHTLTNGFGGDSGSDAEQGDGEGSGGGGTDTGFPTTSTTWTPCCLLPDKTKALCCNCTSYTWQWWEITEVDQFSDGACTGEDLNGNPFTVHPTGRCAKNTSSVLRILGPSPGEFGTGGAYNPQQGYCNWMSWPYVWDMYGGGGDPYYNGHGNPPTSDFMGLCYLVPFGGVGGDGTEHRVGWTMGCQAATSSVYVPPLIEYTSPDCVECIDGLWSDADHMIEWGSLEDCEAANGIGNCVCSIGEEPIYFGTEQDCIAYGCTSCQPVIVQEHTYTPPFPALWYLAWFGPCGCAGPVYVCTTSDHPLYGFYQPTSGLDNKDQCGNYYYQHWGALDATGPFDCTSGGKFTLLNFIQTNVALDTAPCSQNPCNIGTNVFMGCDPVCAAACNGYNFADCHACCGTNGIYATVEPMQSLKELPYSTWTVNDTNGNMLCCPSSATSGTLPPDAGTQQDIYSIADFSTPKMRFRYAQFGGDMEQVADDVWMMTYPPLKFEMKKIGSDYFVNGEKLEVICDDPLIAEGKINKKLLEVTFV